MGVCIKLVDFTFREKNEDPHRSYENFFMTRSLYKAGVHKTALFEFDKLLFSSVLRNTCMKKANKFNATYVHAV